MKSLTQFITEGEYSWEEITVSASEPLYCLAMIAHDEKESVHVNVWKEDDFTKNEFKDVEGLSLGKSKLTSIDGRDTVVTRIA